MMPVDLNSIIQQCISPAISPAVIHAIVSIESGYNQYAIGIVKGRLVRQPKNLAEAIATAKMLHEQGYNFSLGLGQVNKFNLKAYGLSYETAFNSCANIRVASQILLDCYQRALKRIKDSNLALKAAFSCYYSGNFQTGFKPDINGQIAYVTKVTSKLFQLKGVNRNYLERHSTGRILNKDTNDSQSKLLF
jgi:type IV secretion system protein VirB1